MSQFRRRLLMMMQNQHAVKYGLLKPNGATSLFNFGVRWNECNKIVLKASGINTIKQNMIFTGGEITNPYVAINNLVVSNPSYTIIDYYGYTPDIQDGRYFEFTAHISSINSEDICNIWDKSWSKQIIYHEIMFYNDDTLLADFVPDITNADRMYDKVSGTYIAASRPGVYQLVEV